MNRKKRKQYLQRVKRQTLAWHLDQLDIIRSVILDVTRNHIKEDTLDMFKTIALSLAEIYKCDGVWLINTPLVVHLVPLMNWRMERDTELQDTVPPLSDKGLAYHQRILNSDTVEIDHNLEKIFPGRQISSAIAKSIKLTTGEEYLLSVHSTEPRKWTKTEIKLFDEITVLFESVLTIWALYRQMTKIAHYDSLTGLSNRLMFQDCSNRILARALYSTKPLAIFLIDLDNFKNINDSYGHQVGDSVLKEISLRLQKIVRDNCELEKAAGKYENLVGCDCLAARLGGDEFVVVFEHMSKEEAWVIGEQLNSELKKIITLESIQVHVSSSVGVSIYPEDGETITTLLKSADLAMYTSKDKGKDQFCFHEKWMNTKIDRRVEAELIVRDIIRTGQISVFYQPIIDTETECIVGAEALLRGKKSQEMFFDPMELIGAAEDTNLIFPLGTLILRTACAFARQCIEQTGEDSDAYISVNVSAFQLINSKFANIVEQTLHECDLTPDHLVLEITETMLMQDFENSAKMLSQLRDLGVRISIDDFGKGYSSFSYLQKLPIDKVKIDMSFIQSLGQDIKSNEIVKGIILMAHALGMHTCAEGVETKTQYDKLVEFGCEQVQGYYKHKALSPADFVDVITKKAV